MTTAPAGFPDMDADFLDSSWSEVGEEYSKCNKDTIGGNEGTCLAQLDRFGNQLCKVTKDSNDAFQCIPADKCAVKGRAACERAGCNFIVSSNFDSDSFV